MELQKVIKSIPPLIKKSSPDKKHLEKVYATQKELKSHINSLQENSLKPLNDYSWHYPYIHKGNLTPGYRVRFYDPNYKELIYCSGKIKDVNPDGTYQILTKTRNPDHSDPIKKIEKLFPSVPKANIYFIFPNKEEGGNDKPKREKKLKVVKPHKNLTPEEIKMATEKNSAEIKKLLAEKEVAAKAKDDIKCRTIRRQLRALGYSISKQPGYDPSKFLEKARANNPKTNPKLKKKVTSKKK